jgi:hypothetical protein
MPRAWNQTEIAVETNVSRTDLMRREGLPFEHPETIERARGWLKEPNPCVLVFGPDPEGSRCKGCANLQRQLWPPEPRPALDGGEVAPRWRYFCTLRQDPVRQALDEHYLPPQHRVNWPACAHFVARTSV